MAIYMVLGTCPEDGHIGSINSRAAGHVLSEEFALKMAI